MKTSFLFPYWCRYLGLACFVAHVPVVLLRGAGTANYNGHSIANDNALFNNDHLFFIATALLMLIGLFLIAFSKEKIEDEQIAQLRMDSLQWAILFNYIILILSLIFTGKHDFRDILHLNLWVPLVIFIVIFRWKMYRNNRFTKEDAR